MRTREIDHELEIREYPDDQTDNFDSSAIYGLEEGLDFILFYFILFYSILFLFGKKKTPKL